MLVNLDGRWGDDLEANLDRYDRAHPGRFATFCQLDFGVLDGGGGPDDLVRSLERSNGPPAPGGSKIWKNLGLYGHGRWPDDPARRPVARSGVGGEPERSACRSSSMLPTRSPSSSRWTGTTSGSRSCSHIRRSHSQVTDSPSVTGSSTPSRPCVSRQPGNTVRRGPRRLHSRRTSPGCSRMLDELPQLLDRHGGSRAELGRQPRAAARLIETASRPGPFRSRRVPDRSRGLPDVFQDHRDRGRVLRVHPGPGPSVQQGRWTVSGLGLAPTCSKSSTTRTRRDCSPGIHQAFRPAPADDQQPEQGAGTPKS